jgi:hypothetical protein
MRRRRSRLDEVAALRQPGKTKGLLTIFVSFRLLQPGSQQSAENILTATYVPRVAARTRLRASWKCEVKVQGTWRGSRSSSFSLMASYYTQPRSPELKHPVPTHPAFIPEPPPTPNSPQGYQRFASSPPPAPGHGGGGPPGQPSLQPFAAAPGYGQPAYGQPAYGGPPPPQMAHGVPVAPPADFAAWGVNDATAALGMQLGQSAVAAGQQYVQKNVRACVSCCSFSPLMCAIYSLAASCQESLR